MSAKVLAFPAERIIHLAPEADRTNIVLSWGARREVFATEAAFFEAVRNADPKYLDRIDDLTAALDQAELLKAQAEASLERALDRKDTQRQVALLFVLAILAGVVAAIVFTASRP